MLGRQKRRCVLSAFAKTKSFGFSLIELMIGIVVMIILATLTAPSFKTWIQNSQIRTAAESITNGLQRARAEAVARNTDVAFALGAGTSWAVSAVSDPVPPIESRPGNEGSKDVTVTALAADLATPATTVTFNNLGGVVPAVASLAQVDFTAVGGNQNLRVTIGVGGNARMCDPNVAPGSSPRAC
jgi:type IV fimbrial biogenesis protein FimT